MQHIRLDPTIPMICPKGNGRAFMMIDYSEDHHLMWVIAIDETGEIWTYPNPKVKVRPNETLDTKVMNV